MHGSGKSPNPLPVEPDPSVSKDPRQADGDLRPDPAAPKPSQARRMLIGKLKISTGIGAVLSPA
jgi:hypothetical protein